MDKLHARHHAAWPLISRNCRAHFSGFIMGPSFRILRSVLPRRRAIHFRRIRGGCGAILTTVVWSTSFFSKIPQRLSSIFKNSQKSSKNSKILKKNSKILKNSQKFSKNSKILKKVQKTSKILKKIAFPGAALFPALQTNVRRQGHQSRRGKPLPRPPGQDSVRLPPHGAPRRVQQRRAPAAAARAVREPRTPVSGGWGVPGMT